MARVAFPEGKVIRQGRRLRWALTAIIALSAVSMLLAACAPSQDQTRAEQSKARLDHELAHAKNNLGLPDSMLQPIVTQEAKVASGEGGWNYSYANAASNYDLLYSQLQGVEQTASQTLKTQATDDIQAFSTALTARKAQGFGQLISPNSDQTVFQVYLDRLDQANAEFNAATKAGDYAAVDSFARQQTAALNAMGPAYDKLQQFSQIVRAMITAGYHDPLGDNLIQADEAAFTAALPASSYEALVAAIDGQITQLEADQTQALPYIGSTLLDQFQFDINVLKSYGENASSFQAEYDQDQAKLKSARTLADYLAFSQTINQQAEGMTLPLYRGQARQELKTLSTQVNYVNTHDVTIDPANGEAYPDAYEYSSPFWGLSDAQQVFNTAKNLGDYEHAYNYARILLTDLQALQDDLNDPTPHYSPHAADLTLLKAYGITGKAVVVSLREQTARFYDNGKLVYWSYVTTGNSAQPATPVYQNGKVVSYTYDPYSDPGTPSVPGLNYAMFKEQHTTFISPDPPGSPEWYAPTPINFAIAYSPGGYFLHDAWWRAQFGPYTNLPHWDPAAFNGGSHGCVNFPLSNMAYVYQIVDVNEPIILY
jgi:hypothetical protein